MISISEALKIISREIVPLETETIDLLDSVGRVLAEEIFADTDLPPFDRSQMDGFAVRTKDAGAAGADNPAKLEIIGESIAGRGFNEKINAGETVRIMTGARLPDGADAVQKKESTRESEDGRFVEILESVKIGQHFVSRAAEIKAGEKVFAADEIVTAPMIAALAAFGYAKLKVFQKPKVSILATGSEIVVASQTPQRDQIRDSNSASLKVFAEQFGGAAVRALPLAGDDAELLKKEIEKAASRSDLLILSGGVSVGDYDFTKPALRRLGAKIFFERVALRPGKPTVFARLNDCLIFGLPGNPVSAAVTFFLFVRTALLKMQNAEDCELKDGRAVLLQKIKGARERDSFLPAFVSTNRKGKLVVESLQFGGSSNFIRFARANCLVFVPRDEVLDEKSVVDIKFLPF